MRVILPVMCRTKSGENVERMLLFDTKTAEKVCDIENIHGHVYASAYKTAKGRVFLCEHGSKRIKYPDQSQILKIIAEREPETYIKHFGEVEEG